MSEIKPPLKAYCCSCNDDDHGMHIVFAVSSKEAKKDFPREYCDCPWIEQRVVRDKRFDIFAPGPVTIAQYLQTGWFYECRGCYRRVDSDDNPVIVGDSVYHNRDCVLADRKSWDRHQPNNLHESVQLFLGTLDDYLNATPSSAMPQNATDAPSSLPG